MPTDAVVVIRIDTGRTVDALTAASAAMRRVVEELDELAKRVSEAGAEPADKE